MKKMNGYFPLTLILLALLALFSAKGVVAKDDANTAMQNQIDSLKREVSALESLKAEKLDSLEQKEAARWEARYKEAAKAKEADDQSREMEDNFGRLGSDASRLDEELVKARNDADDKKDLLSAAQDAHLALAVQIKRRVDEAAAAVSADFPAGLEGRTLDYSKASEALSGARISL